MDQIEERMSNLSLENYSSYRPNKYYYIVSVDIGITHLGISLCSINADFSFREVIWFNLFDITNFGHTSEWKQQDCHLHHDKTFCDYLEHIFFINGELFESATYVLIERQPPMGLVAIEQLIFSRFRSKAVLISPNSMHCWMGWNRLKLDYEKRKVYSSKFALSCLQKGERKYLVKEFIQMERNHDIGDSICMVMFFINKKRMEWKIHQRNLRIKRTVEETKARGLFYSHIYLDRFKHIQ